MGFQQQILRVKDASQVPMVVCGNKCDLEEERQVTRADGEAKAASYKCPFLESSAKNRINVEEIFFDLVREIRKVNSASAAGGKGAKGGKKGGKIKIMGKDCVVV